MAEPQFIHLRMHTEFSVDDSIIRVDDAIGRSRELGMPAFGVTDKMNVFGGLRFYTHALKAGVKPILGCDIRVRNKSIPDKPDSLAFFCMNHQGFLSLSELLTRAWLDPNDQFHGQIDEDWLTEPGATEGLIALTGGPTGKITRLVVNDLERLAEEAVDFYASCFPGRLYLEVQRSGHAHDEVNNYFVAHMAQKKGLPVVATHPVQFLHPEDFEAHEIRCCIAGGYRMSDPRRAKNVTPEQYLKTEEEMLALFADIPSALANSVEIAKRCNLDGVLSKPQLPHFPTPEGMSLDDYMEHLSIEGLEKRLAFLYPDEAERDEKRPQYMTRLQYELDTIKKMEFPGYFLIVQDFINWSKTHGVPVGPGRGSGAGSLVAYSLGITDLDPLRFDLLFERFLNPERVSMPDFDIDFCQYNRDRTIEYVKETYGVEAVSQIATFGTLGAKAVLRDVCRVLDVPFGKADALSKLIPMVPGKPYTLKSAMEELPEFKEAIERDPQYQEVYEKSLPLEGLTRNLGMHAGGVLIAPGKLTDFCPLYNADGAPENTVSQFDKKDVEEAGLVKFDFLGLTTLSILQKAKEYVDLLNPGMDFSLERIPTDDAETYKTFQDGNTAAIFQFESSGMRSQLQKAKPDRLEDLVALNALYRPGPMDQIPSFIERKFGREKVVYLDPRMEPVLAETYGIMVYQEQVMRVAQVVAGYTLGGADLLRRAMGKKQVEEMHRQREIFIKGAGERNVEPKVANAIFDLMEKFAGYGFNKSHAAAYSYVAYQTAYMKTHHTAAFMAANLCMVMDQSDKIKLLIDDTVRNGVTVLPPDINQSDWYFTPQDTQHIRFGLGGIKGMGHQQAEAIMAARKEGGPFLDIFDLTARVSGLSSRVLEGLIRAGCFDSLDKNRGKLFGNVAQAITAGQTVAASVGQDSLFGGDEGTPERIVSWRPAPAWTESKKLKEEKAVLGLWMSGHMYELYREELKDFGGVSIASVNAQAERASDTKRPATVKFAGVVTDVRSIQTKRGWMLAVMLDDGTASTEVTLFNETYDKYRRDIAVDSVLCVTAQIRYNKAREQSSISVQSILTLDRYRAARALCLDLVLDGSADKGDLDALQKSLQAHSAGSGMGVAVRVTVKHERLRGAVTPTFVVKDIEALMSELLAIPTVSDLRLTY